MATVLFPLPDRDFDTTEVAVPWQLLREAGHACAFATEVGAVATCDPLLLTGVVFGKLGARADAIAAYRELERAPEFTAPLRWDACRADAFDALFLAGGHAPGMRQYLGSELVQELVAGGRALRETGRDLPANLGDYSVLGPLGEGGAGAR